MDKSLIAPIKDKGKIEFLGAFKMGGYFVKKTKIILIIKRLTLQTGRHYK